MKTASKGIVTAVLLALARVAGETAPLLFTAFGNRFWNHDLTQPIAALPLQIFTYAISPYEDWHRQAWAGALVLVTHFPDQPHCPAPDSQPVRARAVIRGEPMIEMEEAPPQAQVVSSTTPDAP